MPSYQVRLTDPTGQTSEAVLSAPSLPALAERVIAEGHTLAGVTYPAPPPQLKRYWRNVSEAEFTALLRQLAGSLEAGVSLPAALGMYVREARNPTLRALGAELERAVRDARPLSSALAAYPKLFPPAYLRLLEVGEAAAEVPAVLRQLADYAERSETAGQRIRTALIYPQIVGVLSVAMMAMTFMFIIPRFVTLFEEIGVKELPAPTQALLWTANVGVPLLVIALPPVLLVGWMIRLRRRPTGRPGGLLWDLPVIGGLYHQLALLRMTRLLGALVRGGVPMPEALRLAGQGSESPLLQAAMWDAIPAVIAGDGLGSALGRSRILPESYCGQIGAAEASGEIPTALDRLAAYHNERVEYLSARTAALLEPMLILLLAVIAGWIAAGLFLPLISIIQNLSGGQ